MNGDEIAAAMFDGGGVQVMAAVIAFVFLSVGLSTLMRYLRGAVRVA